MPMEVQMVDGAPAPIFYRDIWHLRWPQIFWAMGGGIVAWLAHIIRGGEEGALV